MNILILVVNSSEKRIDRMVGRKLNNNLNGKTQLFNRSLKLRRARVGPGSPRYNDLKDDLASC